MAALTLLGVSAVYIIRPRKKNDKTRLLGETLSPDGVNWAPEWRNWIIAKLAEKDYRVRNITLTQLTPDPAQPIEYTLLPRAGLGSFGGPLPPTAISTFKGSVQHAYDIWLPLYAAAILSGHLDMTPEQSVIRARAAYYGIAATQSWPEQYWRRLLGPT